MSTCYRHLTRIMFWSQDKEQPYIHCQESDPSTVQVSSSPSLPRQSPHPPFRRLATENKLEDMNKELAGHGYSNLFTGSTGSVLHHFSFFNRLYIALTPDDKPNYLVYVYTLLYARVLDSFHMFLMHFFISFYCVGGDTHFAGFLLAVCMALLLLTGTSPIGFIRKSQHFVCSILYYILNLECV